MFIAFLEVCNAEWCSRTCYPALIVRSRSIRLRVPTIPDSASPYTLQQATSYRGQQVSTCISFYCPVTTGSSSGRTYKWHMPGSRWSVKRIKYPVIKPTTMHQSTMQGSNASALTSNSPLQNQYHRGLAGKHSNSESLRAQPNPNREWRQERQHALTPTSNPDPTMVLHGAEDRTPL